MATPRTDVGRYGIAVNLTRDGGGLHATEPIRRDRKKAPALCGIECHVRTDVVFPYWGWRVTCPDCAAKLIGPTLLSVETLQREGAMF